MNIRQLVLFIGVTLLVLLMAGCENLLGGDDDDDSGPSSAPNIADVQVFLQDRTNQPGSDSSTAQIGYNFSLEDPGRHDEVTQLQVIDPEGNTWTWSGSEITWSESGERFSTPNTYDGDTLHSRPLGTYTLTVSASDLDDSSTTIDIYNNGDPSQTSGIIRTNEHPETNSSEIMELPTGVDGSLSGSTATISFEAPDAATEEAYVWFYDSDGNYLGFSGFLSETQAIQTGGNTNNYDIDTSDFDATPDRYLLFVLNDPQADIVYRARSALTSF